MCIKKFKEESKRYGIPFWKLPDFLLLAMAFINIVMMILTYYWVERLVEDPREAVFIVAFEAALILIVGNVIAESSKKVISNYKLKEEFIDLISHQVRTPLTNIKWNLELLQKKKTKQQEKYVMRLADSVEKMTSLVNDFVYLSRLDQSKKEINREKIKLNDFIEEIAKDNRLYAKLKRIKIETDIPRKKICIMADKKKLSIVLNNLIDNAVKYSYEKSQVKVSLKKDERRAIIEVEDHGCGVGKKEKEKIFEKFYRSEQARKMASDGTGVGLYVAKTLTEEMSGKMRFESQKDEGSVFFVSFPLCK
ncbi:MAG: HAMP domain-containing sensor histidine kinase [Candidatus Moranbacteria bacterium]|nr:HAMP domain-containing sensor histidine kinase [Candidatus Moranbacteria bacterium]